MPAVKDHLDGIGELLQHQQAALSEYVYTVSVTDNSLIFDATNESGLLFELTAAALEEVVSICRSRGDSVPCALLHVIGRQRTLLQKMGSEAALQGAGHEIAFYKARMLNTSLLFEQSHFDLVHGKAPLIPRATDFCILQQMKAVQDIWLPFKSDIMEVYTSDPTNSLVSAIDTSQRKAGVDPMFTMVTEALDSYKAGSGKCTQVGDN